MWSAQLNSYEFVVTVVCVWTAAVYVATHVVVIPNVLAADYAKEVPPRTDVSTEACIVLTMTALCACMAGRQRGLPDAPEQLPNTHVQMLNL